MSNIEGGLGIFLNDKVALDLGFGYSTVSITPKGYSSSENKNITKGIGLGLGVVVVL